MPQATGGKIHSFIGENYRLKLILSMIGFGATSTPTFGAAGAGGSSFGTSGTTSPFTQRSAFGSVSQPSPGVSFGGGIGSSGLGGAAFGTKPASPGTTFGATSGLGSPFGKPSGTFGSTTVAPAFGSAPTSSGFATPFAGSGNTFGQPAQPAFGMQQPTFGAPATSAPFGSSAPAFGAPTGSAFPQPTFGAPPTFGGASSTSFAPFGSAPAPAFGSGASAFGVSAPTAFGGAMGQSIGTASIPFTPLQVKESVQKNGITNNLTLKLQAITGMQQYETKSMDELRWEDYQKGQKSAGNTNPGYGSSFSGFSTAGKMPTTSTPGFPQTSAPVFGGSTFTSSPSSVPTFGAPNLTLGGSGFGQSFQPTAPATGATFGGFGSTQLTSTMFPSANTTVPSFLGAGSQPAPSTGFGGFGQSAGGNSFMQPKPTTTVGSSFAPAGTTGGFQQPNISQPLTTPLAFGSTQPSFGFNANKGLATSSFGTSSLPTNPPTMSFTSMPSAFPNPTTGNMTMPQGSAAFQGLNMNTNLGTQATKPDLNQKIEYLKKKKSELEIHLESDAKALDIDKTNKSFMEEISQLTDTAKFFPVRAKKTSSAKILPRGYHMLSVAGPSLAPAPSPPLADNRKTRQLIVMPSIHQMNAFKKSSDFHASVPTLSGKFDSGLMTPSLKDQRSRESEHSIARDLTYPGADVSGDDSLISRMQHPDAHALPLDDREANSGSNNRANTMADSRNRYYTDDSSHHKRAEESEEASGPPVLTREDYGTIPDIKKLQALSNEDLGNMRSFTIYHRNWGKIVWDADSHSAVDVRGLNLDQIVNIDHEEVSVYEHVSVTPPQGKGLNRPATITLHHIFPPAINRRDDSQLMAYESKLRRFCSDHEAEFLSYDAKAGDWCFRVRHFSRYSIKHLSEESKGPDTQEDTKSPAKAVVHPLLHDTLTMCDDAVPRRLVVVSEESDQSKCVAQTSQASQLAMNQDAMKYSSDNPSRAMTIHGFERRYKPALYRSLKRKSAAVASIFAKDASLGLLSVAPSTRALTLPPQEDQMIARDFTYRSKHFVRGQQISQPLTLPSQLAFPPAASSHPSIKVDELIRSVRREYADLVGIKVEDDAKVVTRMLPISAARPRADRMKSFLAMTHSCRVSFNAFGQVASIASSSPTRLLVTSLQASPVATEQKDLIAQAIQEIKKVKRDSPSKSASALWRWQLPSYHLQHERGLLFDFINNIKALLRIHNSNANYQNSGIVAIEKCVELFDVFYGEASEADLGMENIRESRFALYYPSIFDTSIFAEHVESDDIHGQIFLKLCRGAQDEAVALAEDKRQPQLAILLTQSQAILNRDRTNQHLFSYQIDAWQLQGKLVDGHATDLYRLLSGDLFPSTMHPDALFTALPADFKTWKYIFGMIYFYCESSLPRAVELFDEALANDYFPTSAMNLDGNPRRAQDSILYLIKWLSLVVYEGSDASGSFTSATAMDNDQNQSAKHVLTKLLDPRGFATTSVDYLGVYLVWLCIKGVSAPSQAAGAAANEEDFIVQQHFISQLLECGLVHEAFFVAAQLQDDRVRENTLHELTMRYYPLIDGQDNFLEVIRQLPDAWKQESLFVHHLARREEDIALLYIPTDPSRLGQNEREEFLKTLLWKWITSPASGSRLDKCQEVFEQVIASRCSLSEDLKKVRQYLWYRKSLQEQGMKNENSWLEIQTSLQHAAEALLRGRLL
jgi:nuclear pore complex protein Nup98-Nup96